MKIKDKPDLPQMKTAVKILDALGRIDGGVNQLIDKIRKKRNKDDIIVSGVIAFCILFTLWYVLG